MKRHFLLAASLGTLLIAVFTAPSPSPVSNLEAPPVVAPVKEEVKQPVTKERKAEPVLAVTSDPLKRSTELAGHVLLSKADQEERENLLSSEMALKQAFSVLNHAKGRLSDERIKIRIQAIDHLGAAAFWKENPLRQRVIEKTVQLLENDISKVEGPSETREAVAGDLIELYTVLLQSDSERALDLYARSSDKQKKLFRFAKNLVQSSQKGSLNHGE